MQQIFDHLLQRFPLVGRLYVTTRGPQTEGAGEPEPLPPYISLIIAAMEAQMGRPICFVLPKRGIVCPLAAIIYGLVRFAAKMQAPVLGKPTMLPEVGQHVRVRPGLRVFACGGEAKEFPGRLWLVAGNGSRTTFPISEVDRLERTDLPTRRLLKLPLRHPPLTPLDLLIGTQTFGNQSLFQNEAILLDTQGDFEQIVKTVCLQASSPTEEGPVVTDMLPFGGVEESSTSGSLRLVKWDPHCSVGEPLVAITHDIELLRDYCLACPASSKLVIMNGLSRALRNQQAFDDIAQTQHLVLLADHDEEEAIGALGRRDCRFWWLARIPMLGL